MTQTVTVGDVVYRPATVGTAAVQQVGRSEFFEQVYRADLSSVFFNLSEFSEAVMIRHSQSGEWRTYSAIFDDPTVNTRVVGDFETIDVKPQFMVAEGALLFPIGKEDRVMIRGKNYLVDDVQSDGVGVVTVMVKKR